MSAQPQLVDPTQATAAQIPLQSFTIPPFPPEAKHLRALTLTSDIKLDEYQSLLDKAWSIPSGEGTTTIAQTCPSLEALTLELFSLGYPPGFLSVLANDVAPNTKTLTVYSQLLAGISDDSRDDAIRFFERLTELRALHLLDVFARPGFWSRVAPFLRSPKDNTPTSSDQDEKIDEAHPPPAPPSANRKGLLALELNYTTQHSDPLFLSKVHSSELPLLISPTLISLSFNVSEADVTNDPEDPANAPLLPKDDETDEEKKARLEQEIGRDGVMTFNKSNAVGLVKALTEEGWAPRELRLLNLTLYTLGLGDLRRIMERHTGLLVVGVTVEVEEAGRTRKEVVRLLKECAKGVEQMEVVVSPSLGFYMQVNRVPSTALKDAFPSKEDLEELDKAGCKLQCFKATVLRSAHLQKLEWEKKGGKWTGGFIPGTAQKEEEDKRRKQEALPEVK
ncbi:hypothetical protein BDZ85DRAFT_284757 [Elsinoe ampelina]|uniref:Uncharacterized protein n=1 Tax=Elsinoe ampelina TaxID=302913 RepID=A0A6A6G3N0_9PEZI|nr:hypothetical protein BDZ85DRAFT_284757 [Elsinoe ampelina]